MPYTTIDNPELYFQTKVYSGNGSSGNAITLDGSENMQPDFVWIKNRATTGYHTLFDSARGVEKPLWSNANSTEGSDSNTLTAFGSDGFTVGSDAAVNGSGNSIVAWCWKESATAGMDIALYSGNGTSGNTFSHSLSAVPHLVFCKIRNAEVADWYTYNASLGNTKNIYLNTTGAVSTSNLWWNATTPTSSVVTLGDQTGNNGNGRNFVSYLFAPKTGYSKFFSYRGNGSNSGTYVHLGFSPAFILIKKSNASGTSWVIFDNKRNTFNERSRILQANDEGAEESSTNRIDFTASGFKLRGTWTVINNSGDTYIGAAFASRPLVNSEGVPSQAE